MSGTAATVATGLVCALSQNKAEPRTFPIKTFDQINKTDEVGRKIKNAYLFAGEVEEEEGLFDIAGAVGDFKGGGEGVVVVVKFKQLC